MSLIAVGTMAFDAIETPFGKVDQIVGGSAVYVAYAASNFIKPIQQVSIIGYDFPKEELEEYKEKDPIQQVLKTILENKFATEEEIKVIDQRVEGIVVGSVKFAEESPWPDDSEVLKDIYMDQNYPFILD